MRLYLVRHARPDVPDGVCYGSSDLSVMPEENIRAACALAPLLPPGVPLYTSPLRRCRQLADVLVPALGLTEALLDARLTEMDFGCWERRAWNDIARAEVDAWTADLIGYRPGGGESVLQMARRVHAFYRQLKNDGRDAIVICHAGTIRLLLACRNAAADADIALSAASALNRAEYGELLVMDC